MSNRSRYVNMMLALRLTPISPPICHNFQQLSPKQQELAKLANTVARVLVALVPPGPQRPQEHALA